jgi:hypothetical protein
MSASVKPPTAMAPIVNPCQRWKLWLPVVVADGLAPNVDIEQPVSRSGESSSATNPRRRRLFVDPSVASDGGVRVVVNGTGRL